MRSYLQIIILILLNFTADCGAVIMVHKSVGENVHLSLNNHTHLSKLKWRKDQHLIVILEDKKPDVLVKNKYDINSTYGTLIVKNLTVNDSGMYQAQTGIWEKTAITYRLKVHETVSKPHIKIINKHQSNFSFCHVLVQCSVGQELVVYTCNLQHCSPKNISLMNLNMTIHITKDSELECSVSNHGSQKSSSIHWNSMCPDKHRSEPNTTDIKIYIYIACLIIVLVGLMALIGIKIRQNSRKKVQNEETFQQEKDTNTVYSVVNKPQRTEAPAANNTEQSSPTTVYDYPTICVPQNAAGSTSQKDDGNTVYWKLGQKHQP